MSDFTWDKVLHSPDDEHSSEARAELDDILRAIDEKPEEELATEGESAEEGSGSSDEGDES